MFNFYILYCFLFIFYLVNYNFADHFEDVKIEVLANATECKRKSVDNDYVTVHFRSSWSDGTPIANT